MKKLILTLVVVFAFATTSVYGQAADQDKKPAIVFVEDGSGNVFNGKIYASTVRGASRGGNGNSNDAFGNPGDWTVDLTVNNHGCIAENSFEFVGPPDPIASIEDQTGFCEGWSK